MIPLKLRVGFVTDTGRARERNEDALSLYMPYDGDDRVGPLDGLFVVADGMGGHDAGDQASRFVADSVANALTRGTSTAEGADGEPTGDVIAEWLRRALRRIDRELRKEVKAAGLPNQAGSTATVAAVLGDTLHLAHVGDSRAYRLRSGELEQLTRDHSWVADQVRAGLMTPEDAATHPKRHMLTHCLGIGQAPSIDVDAHPIMAGDRFLLSSDGLHGVVPDRIIARVLGDEADAQVAARRLTDIANEAGGPDNVTVIVLDASASTAAPHHIEGDTAAAGVTSPGSETARPAASPGEMDPAGAAVDGEGNRSNLAVRAILVSGLLMIVGATTFGAWHYLGAPQGADTATAADATATGVPEATPPADADSTSPSPDASGPVTPPADSTATQAPVDTTAADTAGTEVRVPVTEPDTLAPGARP
jgi:protein phosphatase